MAARRLIRRAAVTGGPDAAELAWALGRFDEVRDPYAYFSDWAKFWREHRTLILRAWRKAGGVGDVPILKHLRGARGVSDDCIRWCVRHGSDEARAKLAVRLCEWAKDYPQDKIITQADK